MTPKNSLPNKLAQGCRIIKYGLADLFRRRPLTIHLYTICWNEEPMLEFFFRHYGQVADKIVVFDDGSTDGSLEIMARHPNVEVRPLPRLEKDSYVLAAQAVHDNCWKESRGEADWVILTAVDEMLYHPDLPGYIRACQRKGITAVPALGYQMISEVQPDPDREITETIRRGAPWKSMNKLILFKPDQVAETHYEVGRHKASPRGNIFYPKKDELLNLHFRYISFDDTFNRHKSLDAKRGSMDKEKKWGDHYRWEKEELKKSWEKVYSLSVEDIHAEGYCPDRDHSPLSERWWRSSMG